MKTHITIILDGSGSMGNCVNDTIGGFNTFLSAQKKLEGEATITMVQFNSQYRILMDMVPLSDSSDLTAENYVPSGGTALLDAIGRTVNRVEHQIEEMNESQRPEKTIFVIITDGEENESREFNRDQIMQMINRHREEMGWEFVFIGANQDAIQAGNGLGVRQGRSINYDASGAGTQVMFASLTSGMNNYRSKGLHEVSSADYSFFDSTADKKDDFLKNPKGPLQNMYVDSTRKTRSSKKNKDTK